MNALTIHLWKEWRDLRSLVAMLTLTMLALGLLAVLALGAEHVNRPEFLPIMASCALALSATAVAGRAIGHELSEGGIAFLRRLPTSLIASFAAKLIAYVTLSTTLSLLATFAVAAARHTIAHGPWLVGNEVWSLATWPLVFALALLAVSTWVPSSGWAPPAALLLLGLIAAPAQWAAHEHPDMAGILLQLATWSPAIAAPLALCAAMSYVRGYRFAARSAAILNGLPVLLAICLPVWAWTAREVHRWEHLDPCAADARIVTGFVGSDARYAYLSLMHDGALAKSLYTHTIRVDLATGAWTTDGGHAHHYGTVGALDGSPGMLHTGSPVPFLLRTFDGPVDSPRESDLIDTRTGQIVACTDDRVRAAKRATTGLRSADGRRAWPMNGKLEIESRDRATFEMLANVRGSYTPRLIDLARGREATGVAVLAAGWLMRDPSSEAWRLRDPETDIVAAAAGLRTTDRWLATHDDHRLWMLEVESRMDPAGTLVLVDVTTGERREIDGAELRHGSVFALCDPSERLAVPARTPDGRRVYAIRSRDGTFLARFDDAQQTFAIARGTSFTPPDFFAILDGDHAVVTRNRRELVRVRFGSNECEPLFPRTDP